MDSGYILSRRPFRDNSFLVDLLTQQSGRITCVARVAKKRGKIMAGTLEPFRLLRIDWIGKGEVQTLTLAEEQGRYRLPVTELCKALYLNELVLKLVPKHAPANEVYVSYQQALEQITRQSCDLSVSEMGLLESLGYSFRNVSDLQSCDPLQTTKSYCFSVETGLCEGNQGIPISGKLLIKLNDRSTLDTNDRQELRFILNRLIDILLAGKKLNSRKLAFEYF